MPPDPATFPLEAAKGASWRSMTPEGDEANLAELMTRYRELGHRVEAHMNLVLGPAKHDDTD